VERWDHEAAAPAEVFAHLAELGFLGMRVPETAGGMGMGLPSWTAALTELAWGEAGIAVSVVQSAHATELLLSGDTAVHREWVSRAASGARLCAALAEELAGSDLAAIVTTAAQTDNGWVLIGEKRWVTDPSRADAAVVLALSEGVPALFLVPTDTPGWSVTGRDETMGLRTAEVATVRLDEVRVPKGARIGEAGEGLRILARAQAAHRIGIAAVATGIANAAFEHARTYADVREQFGAAIRSFEGIQIKLADMAIRTAAAEALLATAARGAADADAAKIFASEIVMNVSTEAVQVFGGYGYMRDYPVEKLMRDAKATEILAGASALLRLEIAGRLYDSTTR
jgi:alkylation response protein AidB-like acyl-CoA dehydrogenase